MATKPAAGTAINAGNPLATGLKASWLLAEGSGATSVDSVGAHTYLLTLENSGGTTWTTDGNGDACINCGNTGVQPLSVATGFTLSGAASWSIATRAKKTINSQEGMLIGNDTNTTDFVWMRGQDGLFQFTSSNGVSYQWTVADFTQNDDWVLTYDLGTQFLHLYHNGTEVTPALAVSGADIGPGPSLSVNSVGSGYSGTGDQFSFVGQITYMYVWAGVALTSGNAGTLHSTPYTFYTASNPVPALTSLTPNHVPNIAGTYTIAILGSGFISGSQANLQDYSLPTTFLDGGNITANVTRDQIAAEIVSHGVALLSVFNSGPGGGTSNSLPMTVDASKNDGPLRFRGLAGRRAFS